MNERATTPAHLGGIERTGRLVSLDVCRGLAVIGMMLVDWTGSWDLRYDIFEHARWLGVTPPDFVFPLLLFIMGVAVPLSLTDARLGTTPRRTIHGTIVRRALLLFAFGYLLNVFWDWEPGASLTGMRVMGVLQRYALVYPIAAWLHLRLSTRALLGVAVTILLGYWATLTLIPVPGFGPPDLARFPEGGTVAPNLATWLDQRVLGHHIGQSYPHDPEGLLTTLPAIATALIGVVVGRSLRGEGDEVARRNRLLIAGGALVAAGALWSLAFPLSKKLWTSSFVLLTGGASLLLFAVLHWFVDVRGKRRLVGVPLAFGGNALLTILLFTFVDNLLRVIPIGQRADHSRMAVKDFLYERALQPAFSPKNAAWVYSVVGIALLLPLFGLLRRRRIFLRA